MILGKEKGVALFTILVIVFILLILASAMLNLISSQTRTREHDISRIKSKYANEAVMVRELELLRKGMSADSSHAVSGRYDSATQTWTVDVDTGSSSIADFSGVTELNITVDYSTSF